jgi:hypothetical protein
VSRLRGDTVEPRADRRVALKLQAALVRDVRVGVQRDVRDRVPLADEELAAESGAVLGLAASDLRSDAARLSSPAGRPLRNAMKRYGLAVV